MTALEFMEKQFQKHQKNFEREFKRGVPNEQLFHIMEKAGYYKAACEALRKAGGISPLEVGNTIRINLPKDKKIMTYNGEEVEFDYEAEDG